MPGTVLDDENIAVNQINKAHSLVALTFCRWTEAINKVMIPEKDKTFKDNKQGKVIEKHVLG